jgi:hypothetical protein
MGSKRCAVHDKEFSVSSCRQCGKELCKSCVMVTPVGSFCSSECSVLHRELKSQGGGGRKSSSGAMKGLLLVLLLVAAAFVIHLAPMTTGKPYDIVGMILNRTQSP